MAQPDDRARLIGERRAVSPANGGVVHTRRLSVLDDGGNSDTAASTPTTFTSTGTPGAPSAAGCMSRWSISPTFKPKRCCA